MKQFAIWIVLILVLFQGIGPTKAIETDCFTRDPSTIVKQGNTYWIYGTGRGIRQFSSTDRLHWTFRGPVFGTTPAWVATAVPANKGGNAWAPDIHYFNGLLPGEGVRKSMLISLRGQSQRTQGLYYLYYAYSSIGSKTSAIGVAVNATLDPKGWTDLGMVIASGPSTDYNTIDPCIFQDAAGNPWLSFGSYFSGIKIIRIDPATGKQSTADRTVYSVAEHPQSPGNSIEASAVYYHDGYYYLFVNWDSCLAGSKSTYNIRIGRSRSVTGPYRDMDGKDMMQGGGTLFLGSRPDKGDGTLFDDEVGPGHAAILSDTDGYWFSCHYEWARDNGGRTTVNLFKLTWTDGWPSLHT